MNILATGDWHIQPSNLDRCEIILDQVIAEIQSRRVDYLLHLGDFKSQFNPVDVRVTNFIIHTVKTIRKYCPVLSLLGNHDRSGPQDHFPSIVPTLESAGAVVFDAPAIYTLNKQWKMYAVPYIRDQKKLQQYLDAKHEPCQILALHASAKGCRLNTSYSGSSPDAVELRADRYKICLTGHIHMPQQIRPNIYNVGSPFPTDWGEANQEKSLLFLGLDNSGRFKTPKCVPTNTPTWWDPALPGFNKAAAQSKPCHIRIRVPFEDMATAGAAAKKTYPRATLHLIPTFTKVDAEAPEDLTQATDATLIRRFLERNPSLVDEPEAAVEYLISKLKATGAADTFQIRSLKLKSCTATNVLCLEDTKLRLDFPGVTLVTGENRDWPGHSIGAGKTSLLSLPVIALFGETPKGQKHNQWLRRNAKKGAVTLDLELPGKRACAIERNRPADLRVTVDGKPQTMGDAGATQKLIERLTGLTWDVLVNALYITQNEVGTILTGTDKERQHLFSRFLGLERFIQALEAVRADHGKIEKAIENLEYEEQECSNQINTYDQLLKQATGTAQYISGADYKTKLAALRKELAGVAETKEDDNTSKVALERRIQKLSAASKSLDRKIVALDTEIGLLDSNLEKLQDLSQETNCPLCGTPVKAKELERHKAEITQKKQKLGTACRALHSKQLTIDKARVSRESRLRYIESCMLNNRLESERIHSRIEALRQQRDHSREIEEINAQYQSVRRSWQRKLDYHRAYHEFLLQDYKFLEGCMQVVARDGLPVFLCSTVCPQLSRSAAEFSEAFSSSEIQVQFAVVDGSIDVQVQNLHGGAEVIDQSRGEMQLAALTAAFALRDVLAPLNVLILDEPSEGMDAESARTFAAAINDVTRSNKRFDSILIVSHNAEILAALRPDRHLEVVKQGGISKVYER